MLALPKKRLKLSGMKTWLTQYKVHRRSSTVTNAFVAALLPHDQYEESEVRGAMIELGQKDDELSCVYCKEPATTWDHLINLVKDRKANGHGHRVRNLVPCCSSCNSSKAGTPFDDWIQEYQHPKKGLVEGTHRIRGNREELVKMLSDHHSKCLPLSAIDLELERQLMSLRDEVLVILQRADKLVADARPMRVKVNKSSRKRSGATAISDSK